MDADLLKADPIDEGYELEPFTDQSRVTQEDVLELWRREDVIPETEAKKRVHEVHLVALHESDGLVGLSSAYLRRNDQLGLDLWYYRAYVSTAHRMSNVAVNLAVTGRDLLQERFVSGQDVRGQGIIYVVENEGLKRHFNDALWLPTGVTFIGVNAKDDHVRVRYFPGALAAEAPR
jgi:hypothetical protein